MHSRKVGSLAKTGREIERRGGERVQRFHVPHHHALWRPVGNLRRVFEHLERDFAGRQKERRLVQRHDAIGAEALRICGAAFGPQRGFIGRCVLVQCEPAGEAGDRAIAGDADRRGPLAKAGKGLGAEEWVKWGARAVLGVWAVERGSGQGGKSGEH